MSRETAQWLNSNTLIGFTDKRGSHAWHYRAELQSDESNHYAGAIPVADVQRRLFAWDAIEAPLSVAVPATLEDMTGLNSEGLPIRVLGVPDRKAIVRNDTHAVFGVFKSGYAIHQYSDWLLGTVSNILGDTLAIGSAGLLKAGAVAWVSVEVPESITTPEGVEFRPNLLASTSHDGTMATTFARVVTLTVCDNTLAIARNEAGQKYKIKHSRHSGFKLADARDALALIHSAADDYAAQVTELCQMTVTDKQWSQFLDASCPMPDEAGRARTMAESKREDLTQLWRSDMRVAPWANTAFGVVQAVNTWTHHKSTVRGMARPERNALKAISGEFDTLDRATLETIGKVLASA
jgi:phage/plasmid-like protein (TIGR03299 family)